MELLLGYAFCWQRYAIGADQSLLYQKALNGARYDGDVVRQSLNLVLKTIKASKQPRRSIKGQQLFLGHVRRLLERRLQPSNNLINSVMVLSKLDQRLELKTKTPVSGQGLRHRQSAPMAQAKEGAVIASTASRCTPYRSIAPADKRRDVIERRFLS
jgi:hypothetical protein